MLIQKDKIGQKGAWPRSRDLLFKFWDPLISVKRLEIQITKFARRLSLRDTEPKNEKMVKIVTPISGTAEDTNLKFCMQIDLEGY